jgi:hypothetical protein
MLRDTNGVERKKEGARTQQPVTHTSVARCWVLRPFLGLRVVCMFLPIFPCLCPWGEKSQLQKSRVPFPNARRPGTRSHVAHLIAVPPGRALVNFSARAEQRHARYGRSAVALVPSAFGGLAPRRGSFPCHGALSWSHADVLGRGTPRAPAQHR